MNDRAKFTEVSEEQNNRIQSIRKHFSDMYNYIEDLCKSEKIETTQCLARLEEAQFWAIKGITREEK